MAHAYHHHDDDDDEAPEAPKSLPGGWKDEAERKTLLASCAAGRPDQERVAAMLQIRDKAILDNCDALWADLELRSALMACTEPPDPNYGKNPFAEEGPEPPSDLTRMSAVAVLAALTASPLARQEMAEHRGVRGALVAAADPGRPSALRQRAFIALSSLILGGACSDPSDEHLSSRPLTPQPCADCGCCPCVCTAGDAVDRSSDLDVFSALLSGTTQEQPVNVRAAILGAVWSLASLSKVNAAKIWSNRQLRQALITGATPGEPFDVRLNALGALWAFSSVPELQASMWDNLDVRKVLISSAAAEWQADGATSFVTQMEDHRAKALSALANLATEGANQVPMWRSGDLAAALLRTVSAGGPLRGEALRVLVELTKHHKNADSMMEAGVQSLLGAAMQDEALSLEDRRECGFARERVASTSSGGLAEPSLPPATAGRRASGSARAGATTAPQPHAHGTGRRALVSGMGLGFR